MDARDYEKYVRLLMAALVFAAYWMTPRHDASHVCVCVVAFTMESEDSTHSLA